MGAIAYGRGSLTSTVANFLLLVFPRMAGTVVGSGMRRSGVGVLGDEEVNRRIERLGGKMVRQVGSHRRYVSITIRPEPVHIDTLSACAVPGSPDVLAVTLGVVRP